MINSRILVNGKQTNSLPVSDRGLQYGDGVWETIAIKDGQAMQLEAHLSRLKRGIEALAIAGFDGELLSQEIAKHITDEKQSILKIIITRGLGGRGYNPEGCNRPTRILSLHPWPSYPDSNAKEGVDITLCETRLSHNPQLAGFKHLNRLEQVLARAEVDSPFQEGLVRDHNDHVIEATMSNVFVIKNDTEIVTPSLDLCGIEGIARSCIIAELKSMNITLRIEPVTIKELESAQGLFLSNSIIKIWPVKQFQDIHYAIPDSVRELQQKIQGRL